MMRNEGIDNKMTAAAADWQTAASPGPDDILILIPVSAAAAACVDRAVKAVAAVTAVIAHPLAIGPQTRVYHGKF